MAPVKLPAVGALLLLLLPVPAAAISVDTVGWTDRDRQAIGPSHRYIVNDPERGIHAVWKDGLGDIRYNFRPRGEAWRWAGGVVANRYPRNLGGMDVIFTTGRAVFGTDYVSRGSVRSSFFRDSAPGAGRFIETRLARGYRRLLAATSRHGYVRFAGLRADSLYHLSHFSFQRLDRSGPFPTHTLTGSRSSARFSYIWTRPAGPDSGALMLKETPNNGMHWFPAVNLSDTSGLAENRAPLGGQALYDSIRLYVVTAFPDRGNPGRSRIWFYAKYDSAAWYPVHEYEIARPELAGDYALAAGRPTIGRAPGTSELFVVWEQFDPENIEPRTGLARADLWVARSQDTGRTWGPASRLTGPDSASRRFPFLADIVDDSLRIICFADRCAGFWEQGQGPQTRNPVLLLSVAASGLPVAVEEPGSRPGPTVPVAVFPTVSSRGFTFRFEGTREVRAFDPAGRLRAEARLTGPVASWGESLAPGVWLLEFRPMAGRVGPPGDPVRVVRLP